MTSCFVFILITSSFVKLYSRDVTSSPSPSPSLRDFENLKVFKWTESDMEHLEGDTFDNNRKLLVLDISKNEIQELENSTFKNLANLQSLNLSNNNLKDFPADGLDNLNSLRVLILSNNQLQMLPFGMLAPLKENMNSIDMSDNRIITIQNDFFTFTPNLKILRLNDNQIQKLQINTFNDLKRLEVLDLSNNNLNEITRNVFNKLTSLTSLNLSGNKIVTLTGNPFKNLYNLKILNLNNNPLEAMTGKQLENCHDLEILLLSNTSLSHLSDFDLFGLNELKVLTMNDNKRFKNLGRYVFDSTPNLRNLSMSNCNISSLSESLSNLKNLSSLFLMPNPLICDCRMLWFNSYVENHPHDLDVSSFTCRHDGISVPTNLIQTLRSLNCQPPVLINKTETRKYKLRSDAYLDCNFKGSPHPSITWVTPNLDVYHYNLDPSIPSLFSDHYPAHHGDLSKIVETSSKSRLEILDNGTLHILDVLREDAGIYTCLASNPVSNVTAHVTLHIDPIFIYDININGLFFGALSATGFLAFTLFIQLLRYLLRK